MSLSLEGPVRIGESSVVVLCRLTVTPHRIGATVALSCAKQPLAVLIRHGASTFATRPDGTRMPLAEAEALCPGATARLGSTPA